MGWWHICWITTSYNFILNTFNSVIRGGLAQLGERLICIQEVSGSTPLSSTKNYIMKKDIIESIIDVGSGFILAILIQLFIFPLFGLHPTILDSMGIALIFTVVSMTRSAIWRWYFRKKRT